MKSIFSLDKYYGSSNLESVVELYERLTTPLFFIKEINLPYRNVIHWDRQGLLGLNRENESEWRKYSFVDFVWLKMISELRQIGVSLSAIQHVKNTLHQKVSFDWLAEALRQRPDLVEKLPDEEVKSKLNNDLSSHEYAGEVSVLALMIVEVILKKELVAVVVYPDGNNLIWYEHKKEYYTSEELSKKMLDSHAYVSVNRIINNFLSDPKLDIYLPKLNMLGEEEKYLLEHIASGKYESITINFKNSKMKSLELTKQQDTRRKIVDVLSEGAYQDIVVKTHKGMVTKIQNTVKVMFD